MPPAYLVRCARHCARFPGDASLRQSYAMACAWAGDRDGARFLTAAHHADWYWDYQAGWRPSQSGHFPRPPLGLPTRHTVKAGFVASLVRAVTLSGAAWAADGRALRAENPVDAVTLTPPLPPMVLAYGVAFVDVCLPAFGVACLGVPEVPGAAAAMDRATMAYYLRRVYAAALTSAYPGVRFDFTDTPRVVLAATDPPWPHADAYRSFAPP